MPWPQTPTLEPSRARWISQSLIRRGRGGFRPDRPHAVVPLAHDRCPLCGSGIETDEARQDALLRHGGFGATLRIRRLRCPGCGWTVGAELAEERPPR